MVKLEKAIILHKVPFLGKLVQTCDIGGSIADTPAVVTRDANHHALQQESQSAKRSQAA